MKEGVAHTPEAAVMQTEVTLEVEEEVEEMEMAMDEKVIVG